MARTVAGMLIAPEQLSGETLEIITDKLFALHVQIFDGLDRAAFSACMLRRPECRSRIQVYENEQGEWVGYVAVYSHLKEVQGQPMVLLRMVVGMLPAHQQQGVPAGLLAQEALRNLVLHPKRAMYLVCGLINPTSYLSVVRCVPAVLPAPERAPTQSEAALLNALREVCQMKLASESLPYCVNMGWISKSQVGSRASWAESPKPEVQFFLRENPTYEQGTGLLVALPLSMSTFATGLVRWASGRVKRLLGGKGSRSIALPRLPRLDQLTEQLTEQLTPQR